MPAKQPSTRYDKFMKMLGDRLAAIGLIVTGLVALGTLIALIGGAAMTARLDQAGLASSELAYQLPRGRLLTIGLVEVLYTAATLVALALVAHAWEKGATKARSTTGNVVFAWASLWGAAVLVILLAIAFTPRSVPGYAVAATLVGLVVYFRVRLGAPLFAFGDTVAKATVTRKRAAIPAGEIWLVLIAVAVVFTVARVVEYSPGFASGTVSLPSDTKVVQAPPTVGEGIYIETSDDQIFIANTKTDEVIVYPKDSVATTVIGETDGATETKGEDPLISMLGIDTSTACLLPTCSDGNGPVISAPAP